MPAAMKIRMFYQSLISDWNHGNAHFLRGIVKELMKMGHDVQVFEPSDGWCLSQLLKDKHKDAIHGFHTYYPGLRSFFYDPETFQAEHYLDDADLVLVHEFNTQELVKQIGLYRAKHDHFTLLFHDTHHRSVSEPDEMAAYDLRFYDGALVFGETIRKIYLQKGWIGNVWTWHEAADTDLFRPMERPKTGDLVWIGNWGDEERSEEIVEYIVNPVKELGLRAVIYGVRYPDKAKAILKDAGIEYRGYLPNYRVPETFAQFRVTLHVPRRYYAKMLPGIPTIRPFEAMSCGIPLISAPWEDSEDLFHSEEDFAMVRSGEEMKRKLVEILSDQEYAGSLALSGRRTIIQRHSCRHRAAELMAIYSSMKTPVVENSGVD